jgi:hypothetical protein
MRAAIESASAQEIRRHIDRIAKRDFMRSMIETFLAEELASLPHARLDRRRCSHSNFLPRAARKLPKIKPQTKRDFSFGPNLARHRKWQIWNKFDGAPKEIRTFASGRFPTRLDAIYSTTCCMTVARTEGPTSAGTSFREQEMPVIIEEASLERAKGIEPSYATWEAA